jgi:DNA (cytosine-5)-methyltransferase 1
MLSAISLFTGVGGLDFGFEAAGFRTAVAVEWDPTACRVLRANREWPILEGDIHQLRSEAILERASLCRGEADVLIGGPPCQPFSKSGYWMTGDTARLQDPRADTLDAYIRVLRDTLPKAFVLENVQGLAFKGKDDGLQYLVDGIARINHEAGTNYSVAWRVLNAAEYGVPQLRQRVFLVGSRDGRTFSFPEPTHGPKPEARANALKPFVSAWDAIGDMPQDSDEQGCVVGGRWGDLLPTIPEGQNYLWHTSRGGGEPLFGWRTRYWSFLLKLAKDQPSWTIQAQPGSAIGPFHWRNRKLTVRELCRLQTFPEELVFGCGRADAQKLLGNAVPSLMSEMLAWEIRYQFFGEQREARQFQLAPRIRNDRPRAEPVSDLPSKYRHLIQTYADHPGVGRGVGAMRRHADNQ